MDFRGDILKSNWFYDMLPDNKIISSKILTILYGSWSNFVPGKSIESYEK